MNKQPQLLAIGGAHIDRRGQIFGGHAPGASNPGVMREEVGGGVFNAARNAVQLGVGVSFLSVRGGDSQGETVAQAIKSAHLNDLSSIFLDRQTATYTAIIDNQGDVITALADMEIYETALPRQISRRKTRDAIAAADAVLTDANMPADAIARLLTLAGPKPVLVIAISPAKVVRLDRLLDRIGCLFLNSREAKALSQDAPDALRALSDRGLKRAVLTNGGGSLFVLENGGIIEMTPPAARRIVDVTGAGDALAGVTTAGLMHGLEFHDAVAQGMKAAVATVESREAVVDLKKLLSLVKAPRRQEEEIK